MPIIVSGTFEEVERKLLAALAVIIYRKNAGWSMFQDDEDWIYTNFGDENVCPTCHGFTRAWSGSELAGWFTEKYRLTQNTVHPNVHEMQDYTYLRGECRCTLTWRGYLEVLIRRLFDEMEERMGG